VHEALIQWLMTPEDPAVPLSLEDFQQHPERQQRAAGRGRGTNEFVRGPKATSTAGGSCVMTARSVSTDSTRRWPTVTRSGSGEAPRTPSAGRSAAGGWR